MKASAQNEPGINQKQLHWSKGKIMVIPGEICFMSTCTKLLHMA